MSFTIHCELDTTDGFELGALVGMISFSDGQRSFQEEAVYLDSWLLALNKAAGKMDAGSQEEVLDMVEEPQPLRVSRDPSGAIHVVFRGKEAAAPTATDFRQSVTGATESFVARVREMSGTDYGLGLIPE
jgi:hypothetical protein